MRNQVNQPPVSDELKDFVDEVTRLYDSGAHRECLKLLSERIIEAWFGFDPQTLVEMVHKIVARRQAENDQSGAMILNFFRSLGGPAYAMGAQETGEFLNLPSDVVSLLGRMIHFRHQGMSREAYRVAKEIEKHQHKFPFFYDSSWGIRQVVEIQSGISAMLAGEFDDALRYLLSAQLIRSVPSLRFLSRDAYVKSALIHALFGDFAEARGLLQQADRIPRSTSWAEASIDSSEAIVQAVLAIEGENHREFNVANIPLHEVGEMWPFYIVALQRTYERRGQRQELLRRLELIEQISLPRVQGSGFTGSVLPLAFATTKLAAGDLGKAREYLSLADPSYVGSKILELLHLSLQGEIDAVLRHSYALRDKTSALRQMDILRQAITARAYLAKGEEAKAVQALCSIAGAQGGPTKVEMSYFGEDLIEFAQQTVPEWPATEPVTAQFISDLKYLRTALTDREIETVRLLAKGYSREKIATHMYVTVNTVKTHLASIYRKLGVRSRGEALAEAASRGLI